MGLLAVGDLTLWALGTVLHHMTAFKARKTQLLHCQALNTFLDVDAGEVDAPLCHVHPPADTADVIRLQLQRRIDQPLCIG